jgi:hypothetical protein
MGIENTQGITDGLRVTEKDELEEQMFGGGAEF